MQVYLVGGAVRDRLLGLPSTDRDWLVVGATPAEMLVRGYRQVGHDFPVFLHPRSKEEYALARTERKNGHGYQGFSCDFQPTVTLEEDLQRRDLTINALAQDSDGHIIDPYGGQADLKNRWLRHVSPAFAEDPLRVLRLCRFYARFSGLGFRLAPETVALARQILASGELETLTRERVWLELEKALAAPRPGDFFHAFLEIDRERRHLGLWGLAARAEALPAMADQLNVIGVRIGDPAKRLAIFLCSRDSTDFCRALPLPKHYEYWLRLVYEEQEVFQRWAETGAERRWEALRACGSLKAPGSVYELLELLDLDGLAPVIKGLQERLLALSPATLMAEGLQGAALGERLKALQLEILQP